MIKVFDFYGFPSLVSLFVGFPLFLCIFYFIAQNRVSKSMSEKSTEFESKEKHKERENRNKNFELKFETYFKT